MYNHAPADYTCPICLAINGVESEKTMMLQDDIFYRDDVVIGVVNSKFVGKNPGHVIVVPVKHYENVYDLPETEAKQIILVAKKVALALKEVRQCDGVMLQQNNEPASGQHAFHFHLHLFPRFEGDDFTKNSSTVWVASAEERHPYAQALRTYFAEHPN